MPAKVSSQRAGNATDKAEPAYKTEAANGAKLYRLSAYTTTEKIDQKRRLELHQHALERILAAMIILLLLLSVLGEHFGIDQLQDISLVSGEKSRLDDLSTYIEESIAARESANASVAEASQAEASRQEAKQTSPSNEVYETQATVAIPEG